MFAEFFTIIFGVIFINNFVLARFLGLCPFMGVSKEIRPALGMSMAVIFVMTMASVVTWPIYYYILIPFNLIFMRTIFFILVIATLVQLVEMIIQKFSPSLYRVLGIYLPLITTNCAVLGVVVLNIQYFFKDAKAVELSFIKSTCHGFFAGVGFTLVMIFMSSVREKLDRAQVPPALQGIPIAFIVAGIMAMVFMGFSGIG
jgi:electron transport complex protein RnfA